MIVALNNKCNLTKQEFLFYQHQFQQISTPHKLILCPTTLYLEDVILSNVELGAQNVSSTLQGAYTGETAASQLKSVGVTYCIVGHSERRKYQQETNDQIRDKIIQLLKEKIIPILCIGEEADERKQHLEEQVIIKELEEAENDFEY